MGAGYKGVASVDHIFFLFLSFTCKKGVGYKGKSGARGYKKSVVHICIHHHHIELVQIITVDIPNKNHKKDIERCCGALICAILVNSITDRHECVSRYIRSATLVQRQMGELLHVAQGKHEICASPYIVNRHWVNEISNGIRKKQQRCHAFFIEAQQTRVVAAMNALPTELERRAAGAHWCARAHNAAPRTNILPC